jgi:hypothetical protein
VKIACITIGVLVDGQPRVLSVSPFPEGLTLVPTGALDPDAIAAAVRHTLSSPEVRSGQIPFVRIALEEGDLLLEVADDAAQSVRMLTESRSGDLPLVMEASPGGDEIEALLHRISTAAGVEQEQLVAALALGALVSTEATEDELAFVDAHRRASRLAASVRQIDDEMTASVVPDWLWIATGFGGLGVLLTAVVFLYPETRLVLIPALIALSLIGFSMYGWRSWKELRVRERLQIERAELRARREDARELAREKRALLIERGRDPDEVLARLSGTVAPRGLPAVVARDASQIDELMHLDRAAIAFIGGELAHERVRALTEKD